MQERRKYSEEFKQEAGSFANQAGVTAKQVGKELGIDANMIGRWRRELACWGQRHSLARVNQGMRKWRP
jgi:transposase